MVTVEQLISKLKEFDGTLPVYTVDSEYGSEQIEIDAIAIREEVKYSSGRIRYPKRVEI